MLAESLQALLVIKPGGGAAVEQRGDRQGQLTAFGNKLFDPLFLQREQMAVVDTYIRLVRQRHPLLHLEAGEEGMDIIEIAADPGQKVTPGGAAPADVDRDARRLLAGFDQGLVEGIGDHEAVLPVGVADDKRKHLRDQFGDNVAGQKAVVILKGQRLPVGRIVRFRPCRQPLRHQVFPVAVILQVEAELEGLHQMDQVEILGARVEMVAAEDPGEVSRAQHRPIFGGGIGVEDLADRLADPFRAQDDGIVQADIALEMGHRTEIVQPLQQVLLSGFVDILLIAQGFVLLHPDKMALEQFQAGFYIQPARFPARLHIFEIREGVFQHTAQFGDPVIVQCGGVHEGPDVGIALLQALAVDLRPEQVGFVKHDDQGGIAPEKLDQLQPVFQLFRVLIAPGIPHHQVEAAFTEEQMADAPAHHFRPKIPEVDLNPFLRHLHRPALYRDPAAGWLVRVEAPFHQAADQGGFARAGFSQHQQLDRIDAASFLILENEIDQLRRFAGLVLRRVGELIAVQLQDLQRFQPGQRFRQLVDLVVVQGEPAQLFQLTDLLREGGQLIAVEPQLAQVFQLADFRGEGVEMILLQVQAGELLQLADLRGQFEEALAGEVEDGMIPGIL